MKLFDTHCHLDQNNAPSGAIEILQRARAVGVQAFLCIGVGGESAQREAISLADREPDVFATLGRHPHDAEAFDERIELEALCRAFGQPRIVAVGEVGLDYYYEHSSRGRQRQVFSEYIALARRLGKPMVIHTRDAAAETLEILRRENAQDVGGVIHCFSEDLSFARAALDLNFDLSFSGIVTFKNARTVQEVAGWVPEDRFLIETDSPYLAPVPLRGKRCEPAYVVHTARFIANLRGAQLEDIARATWDNAVRRFGLGQWLIPASA